VFYFIKKFMPESAAQKMERTRKEYKDLLGEPPSTVNGYI
jgi:hypothetical protein